VQNKWKVNNKMDEICGKDVLKNSFILNKQALSKFESDDVIIKFLQSELEMPTEV
jgi:hypothetical protein